MKKKKSNYWKIVLILVSCIVTCSISNFSYAASEIKGDFEVKRSRNDIKLVSVNISEDLSKYTKSIEVVTPKSIALSNGNTAVLPSNWTYYKNETSNTSSKNSYTFSSNGSSANVTQLVNLLQSLNFTIDKDTFVEGDNIEVLFHNKILTSRVDDDNITHYYSFVPYSDIGVNEMTWSDAYNYAKTTKYRGLKGYLATITSNQEQSFIYNNIAKVAGWLGGTRALNSNSKISDQDQLDVNSLNISSSTANKWYWADGPEAGTVFFNNAKYNAATDYSVPNIYNWFSNSKNGLSADYVEPNNYNGVEAYLQFAHGGDHWNDLALNSTLPDGLYIEYSQYGNQEETIKDETDFVINKTIPEDTIFKIERQNNTAKIVDATVYESLANYSKSIELIVPNAFSLSNLDNLKLPSKWTYFLNETSPGEKKSWTFSSNGNLATASDINLLLESVNFTVNQTDLKDDQQVEILFHNKILTSRVDDDGITHYYSYVPYKELGVSKMTWKDAYNYAKTLNYKGLTGYLTTITSQEEQDFIYDNIAKNPGWLGGTRSLIGTEKILDPIKIDSILNIDATQANKWYWADGPESGKIFFDNTIYNSKIDYAVPGEFNNFSNIRNGSPASTIEPNNYNNQEAYLQFAFVNAGRFWNDLSENTELLSGFYVEYSSYNSQKESNVDETDIVYSSGIPQPISIEYTDADGNKLREATTFNGTSYRLNTNLLDKYPVIDNYHPKSLTNKDTGKESSLPIIATSKLQNYRIIYEKTVVKMTVNYIDKNDKKAIFSKALVDSTTKSEDEKAVNAGDSIAKIISTFITDGDLKLNFDGYDDVAVDSYITNTEANAQEYTKVPTTDFSITYYYKPVTKLVSVPEKINFGIIDPRLLLNKETVIYPSDRLIENVKILNTNRTVNWTLHAQLSQPFQRNTDNRLLDGQLFYQNADKTKTIISTSDNILSTQKAKKPLQEFITILGNSIEEVGIGMNISRTQRDYIGNYIGYLTWQLTTDPIR
ncbi:hypothetical protein A5819_001039 [Enterococcus sp. 7E2_DIV0204]|uniref:hypothetical protein n=1 Tax=unclassified Enterococcus TaxID=2608891 RepID=UPI000A3376C0|nr:MULTISPECIES: hypothetical protein [unclassified Enterococcus]OTN88558.1 hypothetical protein A5819_001039 [Enterococcus sp. 7E2_DIV0204]OTP51027.1 hypothetical protein A5884_000213 [Enterococcus sp. 7D2_DIV0200]